MNRSLAGARRFASPILALALVLGLVIVVPATAEARASRDVGRVSGPDRYATAAAISERAFPGGAEVVYIARADVFADVLAAGTLTDGPVLLVPSCGKLPAPVTAEITRLSPQTVIALGGEAAVCEDVLIAAAAGRARARVAGADRYETAVRIAQRGFPDGSDVVYLASAANSPDAVAGGSLTGGPIILVPPTGEPPKVVRDEIARLRPPTVVALGGPAALSDQTVLSAAGGRPTQRLAGADRYATAARIAEHQFGLSPDGSFAEVVYLARGDLFADAVAAGALRDGPVMLVPSCGGLPEAVAQQIRSLDPVAVLALGGAAAVCDATLTAAGAVEGRPAVVPDTTVVLDAAARKALVAEEEGGVLVFAAAGAPNVVAGDVIVSYEVPGVAPQGLLRRVMSVKREGDRVRVGTENASLPDAVHDADLQFRAPLTRADLLGARGPLATRQAHATLHLVEIDDEATYTIAEGVTLTGKLTYDAVLEVDADLDLFPLPHVESFVAAVSFDESVDLSFLAEEKAAWSPRPITLWEGEFRCFWATIGVPISFCPYLTISLTASGTVEGRVTMGAGQSAHIRFGAQYENGAWSAIDEYSHAHRFDAPSLAVQAEARAGARAQLGLEVYDIAGPYIFGELYVRGEATLFDSQLCWGLYAGATGGFGVAVDEDLLGDLEIPELTLPGREKLLAEHPVPRGRCADMQRAGPSWYGTVTLTYDLQTNQTKPSFYEERYHAEWVVYLNGVARSFTHWSGSWDEVESVGVSGSLWGSYRRADAGDEPCSSWGTYRSTGLADRKGSYIVKPSVSATQPVFAMSLVWFHYSGTESSNCGGSYHAPYTSTDLASISTGPGPAVVSVPGGRRICDTITWTRDDRATTGSLETTTATFALADGSATPNCPR